MSANEQWSDVDASMESESRDEVQVRGEAETLDDDDDDGAVGATVLSNLAAVEEAERDPRVFDAERASAQTTGLHTLARFLASEGISAYQSRLGERCGSAEYAKDRELLKALVDERKLVDPVFNEALCKEEAAGASAAASAAAAATEAERLADRAAFDAARASARNAGLQALARFLASEGAAGYQRRLGERLGWAGYSRDRHLLQHLVDTRYRVDPVFREIFSADFGKIGYWDETYAKRGDSSASFEWFIPFEDARCFIEPFVAKTDRILVPGCGDAPFSAELCAAGFERQVNLDASAIVVERMRAAHAATLPASVEWLTMDATQLDFADASFETCIDKAMLDCIMCAEDTSAAHRYLDEVHRVLKPGGTLVLFSAHEQASIQRVFERQARMGWHLAHLAIESVDRGKPFQLSIVIAQPRTHDTDTDEAAEQFHAKIQATFGGEE